MSENSSGWDRFGSGSSGAGPDWLADPADADAPPTWAEPAASEKAARAARAAQAAEPAPPTWAGLVAAEEAAESAESASAAIQTWSRPKSEPSRPGRSGGPAAGKKRSGFGESGGGSGFGGRPAATKNKTQKSQPATRQRSHLRDRNESASAEAAEKKPQSREKLEQRAKNILLYHLGRSMRTRSQLAERLKKKEIPDDIAEAVLDRFEELHLLDDAQYAETFVRSRHSERGLAKRALGYELRKRGIDDDTAEEALAALDEDQEAATARRLVDSRLRSTAGLDPQVRIRRLVGMLARKGYSSSVALRVIREAIAEEGERLDAELSEALDDPGFD